MKWLYVVLGIVGGFISVFVVYFLLIKDTGKSDFFIESMQGSQDIEMITIPFNAEFTAHYTNTYEDVSHCGELPWMRIIVDGEGIEPTLGTITIHFDFCAQIESGVYFGVVGGFVTSDGDSLFINSWGQVKLPDENDPPHYTAKWIDPFEFTGGTGRFEGATGEGMTNSYNSTEDDLNHHIWEGTLTMKAE